MLKLHGFPVSNYVNMVHLALLEKGIAHDYVLTYGEQTEECLRKSPRGKVPFIETPQGYLNEASVILEYLEETGGGPALLPAEPYARAYTRVLMKEIELYIELPARAGFAEAFFGQTLPEAIKADIRDNLLAGFATLARHAKFSPYVAGAQFTLADIVFLYSTELAATVGQRLFGLDLLATVPGAKDLLARLNALPNAQRIAAARDADMPDFIVMARARLAAQQAEKKA